MTNTPKQDAEPVAWRWRIIGAQNWIYDPEPEWLAKQSHYEIEKEPLYTAQPSGIAAGMECDYDGGHCGVGGYCYKCPQSGEFVVVPREQIENWRCYGNICEIWHEIDELIAAATKGGK